MDFSQIAEDQVGINLESKNHFKMNLVLFSKVIYFFIFIFWLPPLFAPGPFLYHQEFASARG